MANHPSAEKRNRQRIVRTSRNRANKSEVRSQVKRLRAAIAAQDKTEAAKLLTVTIKALDGAAQKGAFHRKAASRTISRLSAQVHRLTGG